jgi:hypothetical protein
MATVSKARYWTCRKCGTRNARTAQRCGGTIKTMIGTPGLYATRCVERRPKRRVPKHAVTLRDDSYETYLEASRAIHGVTDESCCVCGKPRSQERRHDRDHGHLRGSESFAKPRGVVCVPCNRLMPRELTAARARLLAAYLERVEGWYAV